MKFTNVGQAVDRVDGRAKVTGAAKYAAEFKVENVAHAVMVRSTIAKGRIKSINTDAALSAPGVLAVITHENAPKLTYNKKERAGVDPMTGETLPMLQDDAVRFNGQPIALVVAESLEQAEYAATLVYAEYVRAEHRATMQENLAQAFEPTAKAAHAPAPRGNASTAFSSAAAKIDVVYDTPIHNHNPLGLLATIAEWRGDKLILHDTSQWVYNVRNHVAAVFGIKADNIQVICPFTGGAFGCTLRTWGHVILAAMAARAVKRPVKLVLTRQQMFTSNGYRPETRNQIQLGADKSGKLSSIIHTAFNSTSRFEEFTESEINATRFLYDCDNVDTPYKIVPVDMSSPTWMRAPGENTGVFALESAMDELAYELKIDPVELRLKNYPSRDKDKNQEWSSNSMRECYERGAREFGWNRRKFEPRSMRDGNFLIGWGAATATYPTNRSPATATATINPDGTAVVQSAATDIGVGTYTAMTQIAADALQLPVEKVKLELGDTRLPDAPAQGGSQITASVGNAVYEACLAVKNKVIALARIDAKSPLYNAREEQITAQNGRLSLTNDSSKSESYADILRRSQNGASVTATVESKPEKDGAYSSHAFGARFCEVRVDASLGTVRVTKLLSVIGAGRIVNLKQAMSQIRGGTIMGIGMALMEETIIDPRTGRNVVRSLADYHFPAHADIPNLDVIFVGEKDERVNPLGIKGIGEVAAVGVAPAVANAVFHATGKRIRNLPITPDKLL